MVWCRQLAIDQVVEAINYIISFDFLKALRTNTLAIIANWMGRVAKSKREVYIKRLKKRRKSLEHSRAMKMEGRRRGCLKCSILRKRRVLEPDYLANLAYQRRVTENDELLGKPIYPEPPSNLEEPKKTDDNNDHRDLLLSSYSDVAWWTGVNKRAHMPPLKNEVPTRSNYSSTSGFRSATIDIVESCGNSVDTATNSDSSDYESCRERSVTPRPLKLISKSETRLNDTPTERSQVSRTSRSASLPLGHLPNDNGLGTNSQLASKITNKPIRKNKRPVSSDKTTTTTKHVCKTLSTCVKCSRIFSNPY